MPGMIGTVIPASRQRRTKSKYLALSKNICVMTYSAPASTLSRRRAMSEVMSRASACTSG